MKQLNQVKEFHEAFKVNAPNEQEPIKVDRAILRYKLIKEELEELYEGLIYKNQLETLDAIVDILYVTLGTAVECGFDAKTIEKAFNEVHRSNMSKLDEQGEPIFNEYGKVMKSDLYKRPNLTKLIK